MSTAWLSFVGPQWIGRKNPFPPAAAGSARSRGCSRRSRCGSATRWYRARAVARQVAGGAVLRHHVADRVSAVAVRVHLDAEALVVVEPVARDQRTDRVAAVEAVVVVARGLVAAGVRLREQDAHARELARVGSDLHALDRVVVAPAPLRDVQVAHRGVVRAHVEDLVAAGAARSERLVVAAHQPEVLDHDAGIGQHHVAEQRGRLLGAVRLAAGRQHRPGLDPVHLADVLGAGAQAQRPAVGGRSRRIRRHEGRQRLGRALEVVAAWLRGEGPVDVGRALGLRVRHVGAGRRSAQVARLPEVDEHPELVGGVLLEAAEPVAEGRRRLRARLVSRRAAVLVGRAVERRGAPARPARPAELAPLPSRAAGDVGLAAARSAAKGRRTRLTLEAGLIPPEQPASAKAHETAAKHARTSPLPDTRARIRNGCKQCAGCPGPKRPAWPAAQGIALTRLRLDAVRPAEQALHVLVRQALERLGRDQQRRRRRRWAQAWHSTFMLSSIHAAGRSAGVLVDRVDLPVRASRTPPGRRS